MAITTPSDRTRWDTPSPPSPPEPPPNLDSPRRRRGYLIAAIITVAVVAAVVVAALALTSGSNKKVATTTPPGSTPIASTPQATTPATVTPTSAPQVLSSASVAAGYRASWAVFEADALANPPNPFDPQLANVDAGSHLTQDQNYLTGLRVQGRHGVGTVTLNPTVTSISNSSATISDCIFDHSRIVDSKGQTISGPDTTTTQVTVSLVLDTGTWKVSNIQKVGTGCVQTA